LSILNFTWGTFYCDIYLLSADDFAYLLAKLIVEDWYLRFSLSGSEITGIIMRETDSQASIVCS